MQAYWPGRVYLVLAACGLAFAMLAVADKLFGFVQQPFFLATLAYALLFLLLAGAYLRGIPVRPARLFRVSVYTAFLILNVLTAAYVFAWRLSSDPTPLFLHQQLARGDALLRAGDKDTAHLIYRDAYRRFPDSFPVLMRMGAINYQISNFERALRYYSRAVEAAPPRSRWRALNDLGQTYWKLQHPEEAIEFYEKAQEAGIPARELPEWHYRLGWAYFDARDYDAAIEHYRQVTLARSDYAAASYYNIACAQAQKLARQRGAAEREELGHEAMENLRRAWRATTNPEEKQALRRGLLGSAAERDPELAPLRGMAPFTAFLEELQAEQAASVPTPR